jgi:hypothetical protein
MMTPLSPVASRATTRRCTLAFALVAVCGAACSEPAAAPISDPPIVVDSTPKVGAPTNLVRLSNDTLSGMVGVFVGQPAEIEVRDANGRAVPNAVVQWTLTGASASLCSAAGTDCDTVSRALHTDNNGRVRAYIRPQGFGTTTLRATVFPGDGRPPSIASVTFTLSVIGIRVNLSPFWDCGMVSDPVLFVDYKWSTALRVPVGAIVQFEFASWLGDGCRGRVLSATVPPGGQLFDSGDLTPGERREFIPRVAGRWEFRETYTNGLGVLIVQ